MKQSYLVTPSPPGAGKSIVYIAEYGDKSSWNNTVTRCQAFRDSGEEEKRTMCLAFGRYERMGKRTQHERQARKKRRTSYGNDSHPDSQMEDSPVDRFREWGLNAEIGIPVGTAVQAALMIF